jgi:Skp family chaperone for outer membrane proteins
MMRKPMLFALLLAVAPFAALAQPTTTTPAAAGPTKIGVVNINYVIAASNMGQQKGAELQKKFEPKNLELQTRQKELQDLQKKLESGGNVLSEEARAQLEKEFTAKQTAYKRFVEDAQADIQQQKDEVAKAIFEQVMKSVDKYAKANGYTLIFDSSTQASQVLLWGNETVDITKQVLDSFNTDSGIPAPPKPTTATTTTPKPTTTTTPKKTP